MSAKRASGASGPAYLDSGIFALGLAAGLAIGLLAVLLAA